MARGGMLRSKAFLDAALGMQAARMMILPRIQVCSGGLESSFSSWAKEEGKHRWSSNIQLRRAQHSSLRPSRGGFHVPSQGKMKWHLPASFSLRLRTEIQLGIGIPETTQP